MEITPDSTEKQALKDRCFAACLLVSRLFWSQSGCNLRDKGPVVGTLAAILAQIKHFGTGGKRLFFRHHSNARNLGMLLAFAQVQKTNMSMSTLEVANAPVKKSDQCWFQIAGLFCVRHGLEQVSTCSTRSCTLCLGLFVLTFAF